MSQWLSHALGTAQRSTGSKHTLESWVSSPSLSTAASSSSSSTGTSLTAAAASNDLHLRLIAVLVLVVTSAFGSLLPVLIKHLSGHGSGEDDDDDQKESSYFKSTFVPAFFDFTKYLGSGIIISTAFVHLLSPSFEELKDPKLPRPWRDYDFAPVITMAAVFSIFTVELLAFRLGTHWLNKLGVDYDSHADAHSSHGPCEAPSSENGPESAEAEHHFLDNCDNESAQPINLEQGVRTPLLIKVRKAPNGRNNSSGNISNRNGSTLVPATITTDSPHLSNNQQQHQEHHRHRAIPKRTISCHLEIDHARNVKSIYGSVWNGLPDEGHDHAHPHGEEYMAHGQAYLTTDRSGQANGGQAGPLQNGDSRRNTKSSSGNKSSSSSSSASAGQIVGVAILEFGVLLHSFIIGLTLAVVERFVTLFVVITLHQMFEGLGLGARLANLSLPKRLHWVPTAAGCLYACVTPVGLLVGLAVRRTYDPESAAAIIVSGVLDALSAGVLLYTGLVELLCAEFLFHQEMREAPLGRVLHALFCVILGAAIMAILGIWA